MAGAATVPRALALRCSRRRSRHCQQQPEKMNRAVTVRSLDLATAEPGTWLLLLLRAVGTSQLLQKFWETFEGTFSAYFLLEEQQQRVRFGGEKEEALQR